MAITDYSSLATAVVNWLHRGDVNTDKAKEFISLAEADLQVRAKLTQWDTEAAVSLTDGVGTLPSDFAKMKSVAIDGQQNQLTYATPEKQAQGAIALPDAQPALTYTIQGDSLKVFPIVTGTANIIYTARFTPLSDSATTNSLLTLFPDAYLQGSLLQAAIWSKGDVAMQRHGNLFDAAVARVRKYTYDRRYGSSPLTMRVG